jgi:hypothetical protein
MLACVRRLLALRRLAYRHLAHLRPTLEFFFLLSSANGFCLLEKSRASTILESTIVVFRLPIIEPVLAQ